MFEKIIITKSVDKMARYLTSLVLLLHMYWNLMLTYSLPAEMLIHERISNNCKRDLGTFQNVTKEPQKRSAPVINGLEDIESALNSFHDNKTLVVFLDFDGTLAPITMDYPNNTVMTSKTSTLLNSITENPRVFLVIISGRGLRDVQKRVGIKNIVYAGNHGLEIESADGTRHDYDIPTEIKDNYKSLVNDLREKVETHESWVEDKGVSLTYHYKKAPDHIKLKLKEEAVKIIESYGFRVQQGQEAIEAKPPVNWNKGEAALRLLQIEFGNDWLDKVHVLFAGDDNTDEDAMKRLQNIAKSFRISTDEHIQTYADFRFPRQELINDLLQWIKDS